MTFSLWRLLLCVLMGYLIGCISPSYLIGRKKGYDVRTSGSCNAGASNTVIMAGKAAGIFVALFDIFKATAACKLGAELLPSNADFCARFDFAPRYPVWLKVWFADEEFPASGRLLLDESAPHYLTIEDAVTVGSLILDQLTGAQHWAV